MEKYATLRVQERPEAVLLVTLDRPEVANAFNTQAALELCDFFSQLEAGRWCSCIVMTGAGERAFCAGADLKERNALGDEQWRAQHEIFERTFRAVRVVRSGDPPSTAPRTQRPGARSALRFCLRVEDCDVCADGSVTRDHAGRRRLDAAPRRGRATRKDSFRPPFSGGSARLGSGEQAREPGKWCRKCWGPSESPRFPALRQAKHAMPGPADGSSSAMSSNRGLQPLVGTEDRRKVFVHSTEAAKFKGR
jgi:hypothetical protein